MKNVIKSTLIALALASTSCFADVQSDIKALCEKTLSTDAIATLNEAFQGFNAFTYTSLSRPGKVKDKYPTYIIVRRGPESQVTTILCGTKEDNQVVLIKDAEQLAHLVPVRKLTHDDGPNMKSDEKYDGYCETIIGKAFYRVANATFLNKKTPNGTIIADEYNAKNAKPFYVSLGSVKDFQGFRAYLEPKITTKSIKPLLMLKIDEQGNDELTTDDKAFLTKYFTVLDVTNATVKQFLVDAHYDLRCAQGIFGDARPVGEKFGDLAMNTIEKKFGEFKYEKLAMTIACSIAAIAFVKWAYPKLCDLTEYAKEAYLGAPIKNPEFKEPKKPKTPKKVVPEFIDSPETKAKKQQLEDLYTWTKNVTVGSIGVTAAAVTTAMIYEACISGKTTKAKPAQAA